MGANYFTPENAWRHLFFIHGCTADGSTPMAV